MELFKCPRLYPDVDLQEKLISLYTIGCLMVICMKKLTQVKNRVLYIVNVLSQDRTILPRHSYCSCYRQSIYSISQFNICHTTRLKTIATLCGGLVSPPPIK